MATFNDLINDPSATLARLVVVSGLNIQSGLIETFYLCDRGTALTPASAFITEPTDTPANQIFKPRIINALNLDSSIAENDQFGGESFPSFGPWEFDNSNGATATITSLIVSGGIATATTAQPHSWTSGEMITIRGCIQTALNVTDTVIVVSTGPNATTFTFQTTSANATATTAASIIATSALDNWRTLSFDGQPLTAYIVGTLSTGQTIGWAQAGVPFNGTVLGDALVDFQKATLNARDISQLLGRNVQTHLYRGMAGCLLLNGTNQYATLTSFTSQTDKTFNIWFRCTRSTGANQVIAYQGSSYAGSALDWDIYIDTSGNLVSRCFNGSASAVTITSSAYDYRDSNWHNVAVTISSSPNLHTLLADNVIIGTSTPPAFTARTGNLVIGANANGPSLYFNGNLDEAIFWNSALSQTTLGSNMNHELVATTGMLGYWQCDDNIGNTLYDTSGNGLTGTLVNNVANNMWTYSGEGYSDLTGQTKPYAIGPIQEFAPTLVDPGRLIYQVHDGPISSIPWVWDKGGPLTPVTQWQIIDYSRGLFQLLVAPQGTITCSVNPLTNIFGTCLTMDGATGYVSATSMPCPAGSMAMEALIRTHTTSGSQEVCAFRNGSAAGARRLVVNSGIPQAFIRNDAGTSFTATAATALTVNSWYWLAIILDISGLNIYLAVNGIIVATTAITGTFNTVLSNFFIGRLESAVNFFNGEIDEVRIWNAAISSTTINNNMMRQLVGTETNLVQYWKFNDTPGVVAANSVVSGATGSLQGAPNITATTSAISVSSTDNSLNRATGSFVTDGFIVGQNVYSFGFANNANNLIVPTKILTVAAGKITVSPVVTLVTEAASVGQTLVGMAGCTFNMSRCSRADLAYALITNSPNKPLTTSQVSTASFIQFNIDDSSDNGVLCEVNKPQTFLNILDLLINWDGFYGATRAGLLQASRFNPPTGTGTSAADFDDTSILGNITPVAQVIPHYGVTVSWGQNYSVSAAKDVIGIIQTNSPRYMAATNQWRVQPAGYTAPTTTYPNATLLPVTTTLLRLSDAANVATRLFGIYSVRHDFNEAPVTVVPLSIDIGQQITVTKNRLGMDNRKWFRVVGFSQAGDMRSITVKLWS